MAWCEEGTFNMEKPIKASKEIKLRLILVKGRGKSLPENSTYIGSEGGRGRGSKKNINELELR